MASIFKNVQSLMGEFSASFIFGLVVFGSVLTIDKDQVIYGRIISSLSAFLTATFVIYLFVDIALSIFNPSVVFASICIGKIPIIMGLLYFVSELCGFMAAAGILMGCFPGKKGELMRSLVSKPPPGTTHWQIILSEFLYTMILSYGIISMGVDPYKPTQNNTFEHKQDKRNIVALTIGAIIGALSFLGPSNLGGPFNPGLVFAPILFSGEWKYSWFYFVPEFCGALFGGVVYAFLLKKRN